MYYGFFGYHYPVVPRRRDLREHEGARRRTITQLPAHAIATHIYSAIVGDNSRLVRST